VIYSAIMDAYNQEAFAISKLVPTIPTRSMAEKIPGIARIADKIDECRPGSLSALGFWGRLHRTPSILKAGFIVPVTRSDFLRSHSLVLSRAASRELPRSNKRSGSSTW